VTSNFDGLFLDLKQDITNTYYMSARVQFRGFTLIELMVAISIVAILAAIGMVMYGSAQATARDAKRKGDLEDIKKAMYLITTGKGGWCVNYFCPWSAAADNANVGMNSSAASSMQTAFVTSGLLKAPLHDPKCPATGVCTGWSDYLLTVTNDSSFVLQARLEQGGSSLGCTVTAPYNYCISQ
jgi:prepilin-type N-terminal cleavage/methylation domain-containing protein